MYYKIILSDLDGTLLNSKGKISEENFKAIKEFEDEGVYFVPASGRTLVEMPRDLVENESIRYIVYSNGAVVYDKETGETIKFCIPFDVKNELVDLFSECDCHVLIRFGGKSYVDKNKQSDEDFVYYSVNPEHKGVILDYAEYCDDFISLCKEAQDVEVISVFFKNLEDKKKCKELIENSPELGCADIYTHNVEIFAKSAGKGNALVALCDKLGIETGRSIAAGDSDNDKEMIKMSGMGLVPLNAPNEIRKVGDRVICKNDDHIVPFIKTVIENSLKNPLSER